METTPRLVQVVPSCIPWLTSWGVMIVAGATSRPGPLKIHLLTGKREKKEKTGRGKQTLSSLEGRRREGTLLAVS